MSDKTKAIVVGVGPEAGLGGTVWRVGCFGGFLVGCEAVRRMLPRSRGTVLFTGATASLRGKPNTTAFAAAKAALRSGDPWQASNRHGRNR